MEKDRDFSKFKEFDNHEVVLFATEEKTGLRSFIAIHNTNLGPATGGTRYYAYKNEEQALKDVLSLSRAMTYKCALAGVPYGGGKGVIIADAKRKKNKRLLQAYAQKVNSLNGRFTTGEDVGITDDDIKVMQEVSPYINGKPNLAGDLAPWAALGVSMGMKAALQSLYNSDDFAGRTFAVKGLGKVGTELCKLITAESGKIIAADNDTVVVKKAKQLFPEIRMVDNLTIHKQEVDVFCPCALGGDINDKTIKEFKCKIICGGANNQLVEFDDGENLRKKHILYVPDYVANAGGLINVAAEMDKWGYNRAWVEEKVRAIRQTAKKIIELSLSKRLATSKIANSLAEEIFKKPKAQETLPQPFQKQTNI